MSFKALMKREDLKGLWISLAVHFVLLLLVFIGFEFSSPDVHQEHIKVVQAVAIDNRTENRKRLEEQREAQRKKEKARKDKLEKQRQDKAKQEKLKQEKAKQEKAKQERIKQEQKAKAAAEKKRKAAEEVKRKETQRRAEAEKARKQAEAEEFERQQQEEQRLLDEEKRQEKLRAEKAAREAEARARQEDIDRAIYQQAIARYMTQHWIKPPGTKKGYACEVLITQSRAGHVLDVKIVACVGDSAFRASVEQAANKPDQLPLPANPKVFERQVRISFEEK